MTQLDILTQLETEIKRVDTESLDISLNELFDMYLSDELDITSAYQRLFCWNEGARSRFIESLLLQMPVPPIYVIETEEGKYELINGLQRFSSYLHLRGELEAPHFDPPIHKGNFLELKECNIVNSLNGITWHDLPTILQIKLKRTFIRVHVVKKTSDNVFKYHMFKRLNACGDLFSEQQIRDCIIRLIDSTFNDCIIRLSSDKNFKNCISHISERQTFEAFDQELVLRFFALKNYRKNFKHDVGCFLTEYMEKVSAKEIQFNYDENRTCFEKTFSILNHAWGDKIFGRLSSNHTDLQSDFGIYHFESITLGIQCILDKIDANNSQHIEKIKAAILDIKKDEKFKTQTTGVGKNIPFKLRNRISISEQYFNQIQF